MKLKKIHEINSLLNSDDDNSSSEDNREQEIVFERLNSIDEKLNLFNDIMNTCLEKLNIFKEEQQEEQEK